MLKLGLTGGIGAGKSTVAQMFRGRGVPVVDADAVARDVVEPGAPALNALAETFGDDLIATDGSLDRAVLAQRAFVSPERTAALNAIMHPAIAERSQEIFAAHADALMVVHDVPLLVENDLAPNYQLSILVDVPADERVRRLVTSRGLDADDARARIKRQATDAQRLAACDVVLDNAGSPEALSEGFDELFDARLAPFADNLRLGLAAPQPETVVGYRPEWAAEAARATSRIDRACAVHGVETSGARHVGPQAMPGQRGANRLDFTLAVTGSEAGAGPDGHDAIVAVAADAGFVPAAGESSRENGVESRGESATELLFASADPGRAARLRVTLVQ